MGQTTTKSNKKQVVVVKKSRDQLLQEFNERREQVIEGYLQSVVSSAIIPNGLLPAEIVEMILQHLSEPSEQFQIASCCKLWLSLIISKSFVFLQRRFVRSNTANGLFWPSVLMRQSWDGNNTVFVGCTWSMHKNSLILNKWYNSQHTIHAGGPEVVARSHYLDLATNKLMNEAEFETHYINSTKVETKYSPDLNENHMTWESVTCYKEDGSSFEIKYEYYVGHNSRFITGVANMDGSNQLMLFDRSYFSSKGQEVEHKIETYDLNTGLRLNSRIHTCFFILGFWKHYVISYGPNSILSFLDLNTGVSTKTWQFNIIDPCQMKINQLLFIRNNTMAICVENFVRLYDLNNDAMLKKINILECVGIKLKKKETAWVVSVAFDDWKLVTVTHVYRWYDNNGENYNPMIVSDVWISIFDLTANYRHLQTIRTNFSCSNTWPVEILLPASGKILINAKFSEILELDFFHPNLMKNTIKIARCHKNESKVTVQDISPVNLTEHLFQELNADLADLTSTTYFLRDPNEPIERQLVNDPSSSIIEIYDDIFDLNRSQQKRITFIYPISFASIAQSRGTKFKWMDKAEFNRHWEIRQDYFSTVHLATMDLSKCHYAHTPRFLPEHMKGEVFFLLFEEFDPKTNQWLICEPFVPEGTTLEL